MRETTHQSLVMIFDAKIYLYTLKLRQNMNGAETGPRKIARYSAHPLLKYSCCVNKSFFKVIGIKCSIFNKCKWSR